MFRICLSLFRIRYGPELLQQLKRHDMTLRHFPQSFEFSTVGGWVATRAGGHYASGRTHIDDFVLSTRVVTPKGVIQTRKLPASGAGPQPERVIAIGSEGIFGIITECTLSVQKPVRYAQPKSRIALLCFFVLTGRSLFCRHRVSQAVYFDDFVAGADAVREIIQSGSLQPSNSRLVDAIESFANGLCPSLTATLVPRICIFPLFAYVIESYYCVSDPWV
jgi:alkyldihydroxyacetonephosphate synthase